MAGSASSLSSTFLQPRSAPRPLAAQWEAATATLTVEFDKLLVTQATRRRQWTVYDGTFRHWVIADAGTVFMRTVTVVIPAAAPDLTAAHLEYTANDADVVGRNGLPAAAFVDFPITIV